MLFSRQHIPLSLQDAFWYCSQEISTFNTCGWELQLNPLIPFLAARAMNTWKQLPPANVSKLSCNCHTCHAPVALPLAPCMLPDAPRITQTLIAILVTQTMMFNVPYTHAWTLTYEFTLSAANSLYIYIYTHLRSQVAHTKKSRPMPDKIYMYIIVYITFGLCVCANSELLYLNSNNDNMCVCPYMYM